MGAEETWLPIFIFGKEKKMPPKYVSEMTDEELQEYFNWLAICKNYLKEDIQYDSSAEKTEED